MDLLTFLRVIGVLVIGINGVYCFVPRSDLESSASKSVTLPIQQTTQTGDISVYDPGVGEYILSQKPIKQL